MFCLQSVWWPPLGFTAMSTSFTCDDLCMWLDLFRVTAVSSGRVSSYQDGAVLASRLIRLEKNITDLHYFSKTAETDAGTIVFVWKHIITHKINPIYNIVLWFPKNVPEPELILYPKLTDLTLISCIGTTWHFTVYLWVHQSLLSRHSAYVLHYLTTMPFHCKLISKILRLSIATVLSTTFYRHYHSWSSQH